MHWGKNGASLVPIHQIQAAAVGRHVEYVCEGIDPQFHVVPELGISTLRAGWHLFQVRTNVLDGELVTPCLYPDYGCGPNECDRIDLPEPDASGCIWAVVCLKGGVRSLRFDPSINMARFSVEGVSLRRVSKPRALLAMVSGIQRGHRDVFWEHALAASWTFFRLAASGQLRAGADHVASAYLQANRRTSDGYSQWLALFDANPVHGQLESDQSPAPQVLPLISVVLPVHNPPLPFLRECLDSVLGQSYANWQLCIVDDASNTAVRKVLKEYADRDSRVQLHLRCGRGHICEATNDALARSDGEFVAFLDHDDILAESALAEVAKAVRTYPDAELIYTDEDKLDAKGRRREPHFKPGWNPELLRAQNYICHLLVLKSSLVGALGGMRPGFEGAQDHDLLLRCAERIHPDHVVHIPKVLYHWRMHTGSTAVGGGAKPYAVDAARRAVVEHYHRLGISADIELTASGYFRGLRQLGEKPPHVSIVIPTRDRRHLLEPCITSILKRTNYPSFDIVIVDNATVEPEALAYLDELRSDPRVTVVQHPTEFNFSAIVNNGARHARGSLICLLNNDIEIISEDWLQELVGHACRDENGVVGCMLYYPDDTIQHAGVVLGVGGVAGHAHWRLKRGSGGYMGRASIAQNVSAVTGACMMVRKDVFDEVAGFDEGLPVAFNDIDFCMRVAERGYRNVWTPHAELYHHESASRGAEDTPEKAQRFAHEIDTMKRRWGRVLRHDPAYNPNLSLVEPWYQLAFPPRLPANQPIARRASFSR